MTKLYSEEDLILPALLELELAEQGLTTTELINKLFDSLKPVGDDLLILFGRRDTRFSQKVRNLISHKTLCPKYADYIKNGSESILKINEEGKQYLYASEYYTLNYQDRLNDRDAINQYDFQGEDSLENGESYGDSNGYISVENLNYTVYELKRKYDKTKRERESGIEPQNGLILDDSFQRTGSVWGTKDKIKLIESILMDIPIPFIYLAEGKRGNLIVIDGRQRLTAIFEYLDGKYALNNLEFFKSLNKKKVSALVGEYESFKTRIEDYHLYVIKIKMSTPEEYKLQIFARVNKTGMQLNPQEIRHALHQGASTKLLETISQNVDLMKRDRMKDRYLVLRYIALRLHFNEELKNYETNKSVEYTTLNEFLGNAMDAINTFTVSQIKDIEADFYQSYIRSLNVLGEKAFKLREDLPINMIMFELTMLFSSLVKDDQDVSKCLKMLMDIDKDDNINYNELTETPFEINIKYHRDSKENFNQRIKWIRRILNTDD